MSLFDRVVLLEYQGREAIKSFVKDDEAELKRTHGRRGSRQYTPAAKRKQLARSGVAQELRRHRASKTMPTRSGGKRGCPGGKKMVWGRCP